MALANYSPAIFNALPDLGDSGREFDARNGNSLVEKIGHLFVKHNMEYKFGLSLLHRHFDIGEEERMVEYRGTSSPWSACLSMTGPAIRAINWAVAGHGTFRPFEFEYSPDDRDSIEPSNPENAKFADAFKALLHDEHAAGLFGICAHPGLGFKGRVEIAEGRTNINLAPEHASDLMNRRDAAWFFDPQLRGSCVCVCGGQTHGTASNPHKGHVGDR